MKRFCTKQNEEVTLEDINGSSTCVSYGMEVKCTEAKCRYCAGVNLRVEMFGESQAKYPDYTVESGSVATDKGEVKVCDVCSRAAYKVDSYLLSVDTVLASSGYLDFCIKKWVREGHIPSSAATGSQRFSLYPLVKEHVRKETGSTPWLICKDCLSMFPLNDSDKSSANERAVKFWVDPTTQGITATSRPVYTSSPSTAPVSARSSAPAPVPSTAASSATVKSQAKAEPVITTPPALQKIAVGNIIFGLFRLSMFIYFAVIIPLNMAIENVTRLPAIFSLPNLMILAVNILFIISGIMILQKKESGRKLSIAMSAIALGFILLNMGRGGILFFKYFNWFAAVNIIYPVIALTVSLKNKIK